MIEMKKNQPGSFGRTLTPFFLDGEKVNEELKIPKDEFQKQKSLFIPKDHDINIRKFTDGYFENEKLPLEKIKLDENLSEMIDVKGKKTPVKKNKDIVSKKVTNIEDIILDSKKKKPTEIFKKPEMEFDFNDLFDSNSKKKQKDDLKKTSKKEVDISIDDLLNSDSKKKKSQKDDLTTPKKKLEIIESDISIDELLNSDSKKKKKPPKPDEHFFTPKKEVKFYTPQPQPRSVLNEILPNTDPKSKRKLIWETPKKIHEKFAGLEWDTPPDPSRLPIPEFD